MRIAALMLLATAGVFGCSGDEITTDASVDVTIGLEFTDGEASTKATIDLDAEADVAALGGNVACAALDVDNSNLRITDFEGEDGEAYSLKAILIEGADQTTLFDWQTTLSGDGKVVPLGDDETGLNTTAVDRISEIARGDNRTIEVRFDHLAPSNPTKVNIQVQLSLHLATPDGSCP